MVIMTPMRMRVGLFWRVHALLVALALLLLVVHVKAHPTLIECVCRTTRASDAVVSAPVPAAKGQAAKYFVPSCVEDVFAETGIRWYVNGPVSGSIGYWRKEPRNYTAGRAAQRLNALGYACVAIDLYDPNEIIYYA